ncbi:MAG: ATP-grasp domain-containing protein [Spirochaetia bacterium]
MTTILILGAGVMQEPGIRIARRKGWRVILADGNARAIARDSADVFECTDLKDKDGLLRFARSIREMSGLDGIFTAGTDFSSSVAWVAEKLGLPGISYATAMRATDKCLMRAAFDAAGVPSPLFASWAGTGEPESSLLPDMTYPMVVKPVDNMGARGVRRVDNPSQLRNACLAALPLSRSSRVIIEEYMEGPEFSLDAIVYKGDVTVCGVADRVIRFPPSFVEMGHTMPTCFAPETVRAVESVFLAGIKAIGIDNGAAKGDIKLTPKGPMVGEIAARLSGGYMSGWTFPLASGVEVTEAALNIAVGLPPGDLAPRLNKVCAERALISIPGIVEQVSGAERASQVKGVSGVFLRISAGDAVVFPSNNVQKCGNVLAVGDNPDEADSAASRALGRFQIRLRPLVRVTTDHLLLNGQHDCFAGLPAELRTEILSMPAFRGDPSAIDPGIPLAIEILTGWDTCHERDWHGVEFTDSVRLACEQGGGALLPRGEVFQLSGLFWRALIRGGHQGATYVIDSAREAGRRGALKEFLAGS